MNIDPSKDVTSSVAAGVTGEDAVPMTPTRPSSDSNDAFGRKSVRFREVIAEYSTINNRDRSENSSADTMPQDPALGETVSPPSTPTSEGVADSPAISLLSSPPLQAPFTPQRNDSNSAEKKSNKSRAPFSPVASPGSVASDSSFQRLNALRMVAQQKDQRMSDVEQNAKEAEAKYVRAKQVLAAIDPQAAAALDAPLTESSAALIAAMKERRSNQKLPGDRDETENNQLQAQLLDMQKMLLEKEAALNDFSKQVRMLEEYHTAVLTEKDTTIGQLEGALYTLEKALDDKEKELAQACAQLLEMSTRAAAQIDDETIEIDEVAPPNSGDELTPKQEDMEDRNELVGELQGKLHLAEMALRTKDFEIASLQNQIQDLNKDLSNKTEAPTDNSGIEKFEAENSRLKVEINDLRDQQQARVNAVEQESVERQKQQEKKMEELEAENSRLKVEIDDLRDQQQARVNAVEQESAERQKQQEKKMEELEAENSQLKVEINDLQDQQQARVNAVEQETAERQKQQEERMEKFGDNYANEIADYEEYIALLEKRLEAFELIEKSNADESSTTNEDLMQIIEQKNSELKKCQTAFDDEKQNLRAQLSAVRAAVAAQERATKQLEAEKATIEQDIEAGTHRLQDVMNTLEDTERKLASTRLALDVAEGERGGLKRQVSDLQRVVLLQGYQKGEQSTVAEISSKSSNLPLHEYFDEVLHTAASIVTSLRQDVDKKATEIEELMLQLKIHDVGKGSQDHKNMNDVCENDAAFGESVSVDLRSRFDAAAANSELQQQVDNLSRQLAQKERQVEKLMATISTAGPPSRAAPKNILRHGGGSMMMHAVGVAPYAPSTDFATLESASSAGSNRFNNAFLVFTSANLRPKRKTSSKILMSKAIGLTNSAGTVSISSLGAAAQADLQHEPAIALAGNFSFESVDVNNDAQMAAFNLLSVSEESNSEGVTRQAIPFAMSSASVDIGEGSMISVHPFASQDVDEARLNAQFAGRGSTQQSLGDEEVAAATRKAQSLETQMSTLLGRLSEKDKQIQELHNELSALKLELQGCSELKKAGSEEDGCPNCLSIRLQLAEREANHSEEIKARDITIAELEQEIDQYLDDLDAKEKEQQNACSSKKLLDSIEKQLASKKMQLSKVEAERDNLQKQLADNERISSAKDNTINDLRLKLSGYDELKTDYDEEVQQSDLKDEEISALEEQVKQMTGKIQEQDEQLVALSECNLSLMYNNKVAELEIRNLELQRQHATIQRLLAHIQQCEELINQKNLELVSNVLEFTISDVEINALGIELVAREQSIADVKEMLHREEIKTMETRSKLEEKEAEAVDLVLAKTRANETIAEKVEMIQRQASELDQKVVIIRQQQADIENLSDVMDSKSALQVSSMRLLEPENAKLSSVGGIVAEHGCFCTRKNLPPMEQMRVYSWFILKESSTPEISSSGEVRYANSTIFSPHGENAQLNPMMKIFAGHYDAENPLSMQYRSSSYYAGRYLFDFAVGDSDESDTNDKHGEDTLIQPQWNTVTLGEMFDSGLLLHSLSDRHKSGKNPQYRTGIYYDVGDVDMAEQQLVVEEFESQRHYLPSVMEVVSVSITFHPSEDVVRAGLMPREVRAAVLLTSPYGDVSKGLISAHAVALANQALTAFDHICFRAQKDARHIALKMLNDLRMEAEIEEIHQVEEAMSKVYECIETAPGLPALWNEVNAAEVHLQRIGLNRPQIWIVSPDAASMSTTLSSGESVILDLDAEKDSTLRDFILAAGDEAVTAKSYCAQNSAPRIITSDHSDFEKLTAILNLGSGAPTQPTPTVTQASAPVDEEEFDSQLENSDDSTSSDETFSDLVKCEDTSSAPGAKLDFVAIHSLPFLIGKNETDPNSCPDKADGDKSSIDRFHLSCSPPLFAVILVGETVSTTLPLSSFYGISEDNTTDLRRSYCHQLMQNLGRSVSTRLLSYECNREIGALHNWILQLETLNDDMKKMVDQANAAVAEKEHDIHTQCLRIDSRNTLMRCESALTAEHKQSIGNSLTVSCAIASCGCFGLNFVKHQADRINCWLLYDESEALSQLKTQNMNTDTGKDKRVHIIAGHFVTRSDLNGGRSTQSNTADEVQRVDAAILANRVCTSLTRDLLEESNGTDDAAVPTWKRTARSVTVTERELYASSLFTTTAARQTHDLNIVSDALVDIVYVGITPLVLPTELLSITAATSTITGTAPHSQALLIFTVPQGYPIEVVAEHATTLANLLIHGHQVLAQRLRYLRMTQLMNVPRLLQGALESTVRVQKVVDSMGRSRKVKPAVDSAVTILQDFVRSVRSHAVGAAFGVRRMELMISELFANNLGLHETNSSLDPTTARFLMPSATGTDFQFIACPSVKLEQSLWLQDLYSGKVVSVDMRAAASAGKRLKQLLRAVDSESHYCMMIPLRTDMGLAVLLLFDKYAGEAGCQVEAAGGTVPFTWLDEEVVRHCDLPISIARILSELCIHGMHNQQYHDVHSTVELEELRRNDAQQKELIDSLVAVLTIEKNKEKTAATPRVSKNKN